MAKIDNLYQQLLKDILSRGFTYEDPNRKGVTRKQLTDYHIKYDLFKEGLPTLTLREIHYPSAVGEFVSFMRGETTMKALKANGVNFWDKDAYNFYVRNHKNPVTFEKFQKTEGNLGKIYPYQMRNWNGHIDQIAELIKTLKENPMATKKTVTMWNPSDKEASALTPCHHMFEVLTEPLTIKQREQFLGDFQDYYNETPYSDRAKTLDEIGVAKYGLSVKWYQHSVDVFLGLPYNFIYYALMTIALAKEVKMVPLNLIADLSNVHIYDNAIKASYELLKRNPDTYDAPNVTYNGTVNDLKIEDFIITNYKSHEKLNVKMIPYDK